MHGAKAKVWGLSITEAMACGLPVVASRVGGIPDQVREGQSGFLVPGGDAGAMADRIQRLLKDPALREQMGRCASETARAQFSLDRMVRSYVDWYKIILGWRGECAA